MEIYLVRHTKPDISPGICYGQSDIAVAASFADELASLQAKLQHLYQPLVYSSPLKRCLVLAESLSSTLHNTQIYQDNRLKELNFGDWEGQSWQDIHRGDFDHWAENVVLHTPPQGESLQMLQQRVQQFMLEISAQSAQQACVIFTHAGVIRSLVAEILYADLHQSVNVVCDYGSVTQLHVVGQDFELVYCNR
jgi:alpha-ribazole phosphatase